MLPRRFFSISPLLGTLFSVRVLLPPPPPLLVTICCSSCESSSRMYLSISPPRSSSSPPSEPSELPSNSPSPPGTTRSRISLSAVSNTSGSKSMRPLSSMSFFSSVSLSLKKVVIFVHRFVFPFQEINLHTRIYATKLTCLIILKYFIPEKLNTLNSTFLVNKRLYFVLKA